MDVTRCIKNFDSKTSVGRSKERWVTLKYNWRKRVYGAVHWNCYPAVLKRS